MTSENLCALYLYVRRGGRAVSSLDDFYFRPTVNLVPALLILPSGTDTPTTIPTLHIIIMRQRYLADRRRSGMQHSSIR